MFDQNFSGEMDRPVKKSNNLPFWGNEKTMNLNSLILTNIQASQYFKVNLYQLKTYHEVIDEIYNQVSHLEPWEKGSRKTGQTGMCGGVRGVGAGGIVSTAFCILYKLYTLKLTRKQLQGLINHSDSPYIRGLGFMYIRYTQPPADLWEWLEPYLDDDEQIDVRAGGGQTTTMGTVCRHMLTKLEWHSTLFPRIPVPIQKDLQKKLSEKIASTPVEVNRNDTREEENEGQSRHRDRDRHSRDRDRHYRDRYSRDRENRHRDRRDWHRDYERDSHRDRRDRRHHDNYSRHRSTDYSDELRRERDRVRNRKSRSRSLSRDRKRRR